MWKVFDCSRSKCVELHSYNRCIVIRGFVYPLGFFDIFPKREVVLQFSDICRTKSQYSKVGCHYIIFTKQTRFRFLDHFDRSEELFDVLTSIANKNNHLESKSEKSYKSMMRSFWIVMGVFFLLALLSGVIAAFF